MVFTNKKKTNNNNNNNNKKNVTPATVRYYTSLITTSKYLPRTTIYHSTMMLNMNLP